MIESNLSLLVLIMRKDEQNHVIQKRNGIGCAIIGSLIENISHSHLYLQYCFIYFLKVF